MKLNKAQRTILLELIEEAEARLRKLNRQINRIQTSLDALGSEVEDVYIVELDWLDEVKEEINYADA